jgi:hypothetical protein
MAYIREGLQAYVAEYFMRKLHNPFAKFRTFVYYMGLRSQEGMTRLGRPRTTAVFGDLSGLGRGELRRLAHSTDHFIPFQKSEPSAPTDPAVAYRGATPTASSFAEDNAGMMSTRWTHFMEPVKVGKDSLDDASGPSQIMSILDNAASITMENLLKRINDRLINGTRTQAQQNVNRWQDLLGVSHVLTTNNYYGRVDRSVETDLNPLNIAAGTDTSSSIVELANIDLVNDGNSTIVGRASKSPDGGGCDLHIVHPKLFGPLREEAKGTYTIHYNGIPGHAGIGHRKPAIEYGNNWITYDDGVPNSEMWSLRLKSWYLELDPRYNFVPQPFKLKSANEEGGEHYEWSLVHAKMRLTCREPWLQTKTTALTDS